MDKFWKEENVAMAYEAADCIIKAILVKENDVIDGNQTLIQLMPDPDAKAED